MASITIFVPDQEPLAYDLDTIEKLSIGRAPDNDVVLDHVSLSGTHATIQNLEGTFQVTDHGSTNGTYLNGDQITEAVLANGAQVMFGSVQCVFADETEAAAGEEAGGDAEAAAGGGAGYGRHMAELAEVSNHPGSFDNLSPIEKVVPKDVVGQVAIILGIVAILAAGAVIGIATTMTAG